jgi:phage gpG-like protein
MDGNDFAAHLRGLAAELEGLSELPRLAAELAAPKIAGNVSAEFDAGTAPDGKGWAPLSTGKPSRLTQSGAMRRKLTVVADGLLVRGKIYAPANIHQYGGKRVPQRMIFPLPSELPESWEESLKAASTEAIEQLTPKLRAAGS